MKFNIPDLTWLQPTPKIPQFNASDWGDFLLERDLKLETLIDTLSPHHTSLYQHLHALIIERLSNHSSIDTELTGLISWLKTQGQERLRPITIKDDEYPSFLRDVPGVDEDNKISAWFTAMDALAFMCSLRLGRQPSSCHAVPMAHEPWIGTLLDSIIPRELASSTLTPDTLATQLSTLEALSPLYLSSREEHEPTPAWQTQLYAWLEALIAWLAQYFKTMPSDVTESVHFASLTQRVLDISLRFHEKKTLPDEMLSTLTRWCAQHQDRLNQTVDTFEPPEEFSYLYSNMHYQSVLSSSLRHTYCINHTLKAIDEALERINALGQFAFHHAILSALNGDESLSVYLKAYQETQQQLESWSINVFAYRVACEKILQNTSHYLAALDYLDGELHQRHQQRETIQGQWLALLNHTEHEAQEPQSYGALIKRLDTPTYELLQKAAACFSVLNKSVLTLQGAVDWAEQGCFFTTHHEDKFAVEMNARNARGGHDLFLAPNKRFSSREQGYHLKVARTITDEAIDLLDECLPLIKRETLKLHPDKQPSIKLVADYAFQTLSTWRKRAEHLTKMYKLCQFYKPVEDEPPIDVTVMAHHPAKPKQAMSLASWLLHQTYLEHFKHSKSLIKNPRDAHEYHTSLFTYYSEDELWWRGMLDHAKDSMVERLANLGKEERQVQAWKAEGLPIATKKYGIGDLEFEIVDTENTTELDAYVADALAEQAKAEAKQAKAEAKATKAFKKIIKSYFLRHLLELETLNPQITQAQFVLNVVHSVLEDDDGLESDDMTVGVESLLSENTTHHRFFAPAVVIEHPDMDNNAPAENNEHNGVI